MGWHDHRLHTDRTSDRSTVPSLTPPRTRLTRMDHPWQVSRSTVSRHQTPSAMPSSASASPPCCRGHQRLQVPRPHRCGPGGRARRGYGLRRRGGDPAGHVRQRRSSRTTLFYRRALGVLDLLAVAHGRPPARPGSTVAVPCHSAVRENDPIPAHARSDHPMRRSLSPPPFLFARRPSSAAVTGPGAGPRPAHPGRDSFRHYTGLGADAHQPWARPPCSRAGPSRRRAISRRDARAASQQQVSGAHACLTIAAVSHQVWAPRSGRPC